MNKVSPLVIPGNKPTSLQQLGLRVVAQLNGNKDVVFAIDLTESVNFNSEGRFRLQQIVKDSLKVGDSIYVVPFATIVNPSFPNVNPVTIDSSITFNGQGDINKILRVIPSQSNPKLARTDIQLAELFIYKNLAQLNQDRLQNNQPIKSQSIVWITDAPLLTKPGEAWIEAPFNSPFRLVDSIESQQRYKWLEALSPQKRFISIKADNGRQYNLTITDIAPTVQEFCTPAPSSQELCLVNPYLIRQLWLPVFIFIALLITLLALLKRWHSYTKRWNVSVSFDDERKLIPLHSGKKIEVGGTGLNSIEFLGSEPKAYLERRGNRLYIMPLELIDAESKILYNNKELTDKLYIQSSEFTISSYSKKQELKVFISIGK